MSRSVRNDPSFNCPKCGHRRGMVIDSRRSREGVRRRRRCQQCGARWSTWEIKTRMPSTSLRQATRAIDSAINRLKIVHRAVEQLKRGMYARRRRVRR